MTAAPPTRRGWTRLEPPEAALWSVALVAIDLVLGIVVLAVAGDASCQGLGCRTSGVSTSRPVAALLIAVAVIVVPVLFSWWRRRGLRTTLVVQLVVGGLLVAWAAHAVGTAAAVRRDPPAVPSLPSLRPCAEKTLSGHVCLTYSQTPPAS